MSGFLRRLAERALETERIEIEPVIAPRFAEEPGLVEQTEERPAGDRRSESRRPRRELPDGEAIENARPDRVPSRADSEPVQAENAVRPPREAIVPRASSPDLPAVPRQAVEREHETRTPPARTASRRQEPPRVADIDEPIVVRPAAVVANESPDPSEPRTPVPGPPVEPIAHRDRPGRPSDVILEVHRAVEEAPPVNERPDGTEEPTTTDPSGVPPAQVEEIRVPGPVEVAADRDPREAEAVTMEPPAEEPAPTIRVTIGTVEVTAETASAPEAPVRRLAEPALDLDAYLDRYGRRRAR